MVTAIKVSTIHGHSERIWCACWSPCGTALATCSSDLTIKIWRCKQNILDAISVNTDTNGLLNNTTHLEWECTQTIEGDQTRSIRCISWSPDGKRLAASSFDRTVVIYTLIGNFFEASTTLEGYENEVKWVDWSIDCTTIATCSRDKNIWIWVEDEDGDWNCESVLTGHTQDIKQVKFHPNNEYVISSSYDNTVKCWHFDGDEWYNECTVSDHTSTVWSIAIGLDGDYLVSVGDDRAVYIYKWDSKCEMKQQLQRRIAHGNNIHTRPIYTVDWSKPTSKYPYGLIATGGGDDCIRIFSCTMLEKDLDSTIEPFYTIERAHQSDVNHISFNPIYKSLLVSVSDDKDISIWHIE